MEENAQGKYLGLGLFIYQLPSRTGDLFPTEKISDFCSSTKEHQPECAFEPQNVLLDLITEQRARHQEYHWFSSVRLEGTVAVEKKKGTEGVLRVKGIVIAHLYAYPKLNRHSQLPQIHA